MDEQLASLRQCTVEIDDELAALIGVEAISPMTHDGLERTPTVETKMRITQKTRTPQNKDAVPQIPQLKPEHAKMIRSEGDLHLLEIVYGLPQVILESIDSTYMPKVLKQYNDLQETWLTEEKYLVGAKTGHPPTVDEHMADMQRERITLHFRVYYALTRPGEVKRIDRKD